MQTVKMTEHYELVLLTEEEGKKYEKEGMVPRYALFNRDNGVLEALDTCLPYALINLNNFSTLLTDLMDDDDNVVRQLSLVTDDDDPTTH